MEKLLRSDRSRGLKVPQSVVRQTERLPTHAHRADRQARQSHTGHNETHRSGIGREVHLPAAVRHKQIVRRLGLSEPAHIHPLARGGPHGQLVAVRRQDGPDEKPARRLAGTGAGMNGQRARAYR